MKIKLLSINIWQGQALQAVCDFIRQQNPDIVVMQEVYNGTNPDLPVAYRAYQELQKQLDFLPHHDFEAAFCDNRAEGNILEGNATFSRFPITARDVTFFNEPFQQNYVDDIKNNPTMPHVLLHSAIQTPVGNVYVFNLHGTWDLDGDNFSDKRRQMAEAIIANTKDKTRVVVAGDTNAKPTNKAMQMIEEHLVSVFGTTLTSTFNMQRKDNPGYATAAVDMVFASSDVRVLEKSCPNVDISDHLPLVVTIEI